MAFGCLEDYDNDVRLQTRTGTGLYNQLGTSHSGVFTGQPREKKLKVKGSRATGQSASGTINTSYPDSDYASMFYAGTSTGTSYTAGSGMNVTLTSNNLSNSYTLTDALNTK